MNRKGFRDPRFEDLAGYALGALSVEEREQADELLVRSEEARRELASLQDAAVSLASLAPAVEVPAALREQIMRSAVEQSKRPIEFRPLSARVSPKPPSQPSPGSRNETSKWAIRGAFAASLTAVAAAVAVAIVFGMETARLKEELTTVRTQISRDQIVVTDVQAAVESVKSDVEVNEASVDVQQDEVSRLAQANSALQDALRDQRWLTYVTFAREWETPSWFRPGPEAPQAQGQIVVSPTGDRAVLFVDGMPELPEAMCYTLWLSAPSFNWPAASFEVDEFGYARVDLDLPPSLAGFTYAAVSREYAGMKANGNDRVLEAQTAR